MVAFISLILVALLAALVFLDLLSSNPDDTNLEATVPANKPHKLKVRIGGDAIRTQIYPDFSFQHHAAITSGRFHIPHTGETGDAKLSFAQPKTARDSYEFKATLKLEPGEQWNLKTGDQIAVEVEIWDFGWQRHPRGKRTVPRYTTNTIETDYIYITVS